MTVEPDPYTSGSKDPEQRQGVSGWEVVDTGLSVAGSAARGVGWLIVKLYALALIAIGLAALFLLDDSARWGGLLFLGYGTYLLLGGSWIIY